jgi:4a-hydroxytetrahydrobiopterin dehydratase
MNLASLDCRDEPVVTTPLPAAEARVLSSALDGWTVDGPALVKAHRLPDFMAAVAFAQRVAEMAQGQDHHPDFQIQGPVCTVLWTTHDAGGLTRRDFICAARTDALR